MAEIKCMGPLNVCPYIYDSPEGACFTGLRLLFIQPSQLDG